MAKTTAQSVCKNNGLFVCLYKSLPSTCFLLLYNFLFMCNTFVFCLKKHDIFLEKAVLILIFYHLFILVIIKKHIALCYQELYLQDPVIIWPYHNLYSEN